MHVFWKTEVSYECYLITFKRTLWRHFQSLLRSCKPSNGIQLTATADVFNEYFLSIPQKTIANVTIVVCQLVSFWKKFLGNKPVPPMQFSRVDVEIVSSQ